MGCRGRFADVRKKPEPDPKETESHDGEKSTADPNASETAQADPHAVETAHAPPQKSETAHVPYIFY